MDRLWNVVFVLLLGALLIMTGWRITVEREATIACEVQQDTPR